MGLAAGARVRQGARWCSRTGRVVTRGRRGLTSTSTTSTTSIQVTNEQGDSKPVQVRQGWGAAAQSNELASAVLATVDRGSLAMTKVLVVTSESGAKRTSFLRTRAFLQGQGAIVHHFSLPKAIAPGAEPRLESVQQGVELARHTGCSAVVALGGAAVMDVAKAISALTHERTVDLRDLRRYFAIVLEEDGTTQKAAKKTTEPKLPMLALPTVLCGGQETSCNISLMDWDQDRRLVLQDASLAPELALVDPKMMLEDQSRFSVGVTHDTMLRAVVAASVGQDLHLGSSDLTTTAQAIRCARLLLGCGKNVDSNEKHQSMVELAACSATLGATQALVSAVPKAVPHQLIASALCDMLPIRYRSVATSLLPPSMALWSPEQEQQMADVAGPLKSLWAEAPAEHILKQGIIVDKTDHVAVVADTVSLWSDFRYSAEDVVEAVEAAL